MIIYDCFMVTYFYYVSVVCINEGPSKPFFAREFEKLILLV